MIIEQMLATVAEKVYEEEHQIRPIIDIPISEKKPRTTTPINNEIHDLLPCIHHKRKLEERGDDVTDSRNCEKKRLIVRLRQPEQHSDYKKKIVELGGSNIRLLVIQKKLDKSDVNVKKNRLSMPYTKCLFDLGAVSETRVKVIQPANDLGHMFMTFARRDSESSYVFSGSWNDLVEINGLQKGDIIQIWSFKQGDELCFAFVKL